MIYCSPAIFPRLLKHDVVLQLSSCLSVCGLSFRSLKNHVCERHIKAPPDFATRIRGYRRTSARNSFKLLPSKPKLSLRHCHAFLLSGTHSWTTEYTNFLDEYPLLPLYNCSRFCLIRMWTFYFPCNIEHLLPYSDVGLLYSLNKL